MDSVLAKLLSGEKNDIGSSPFSFILPRSPKLILANKNLFVRLKNLSRPIFLKKGKVRKKKKKKKTRRSKNKNDYRDTTGTTRRNTRCRGTNRGTEVDSCGIGMATTPMATRDLPCDSHLPPRNRRDFANAFWTQRTRHVAHFQAFFDSPTPHVWWESFRNTRGPGKGRRRSHRRIPFNNLNHLSLRLIER